MQTEPSSRDQSPSKTLLPLTPQTLSLSTLKALSSNRSYLKKPAGLKMYRCLVYRFGGKILASAVLEARTDQGEAVEIIF